MTGTGNADTETSGADSATSGLESTSDDEGADDWATEDGDGSAGLDDSTTGDPPGPDLFGVWGLPLYGAYGKPDVTLILDEDGTFEWVETNADCSIATVATGEAVVTSRSLVLDVETWSGPLPFGGAQYAAQISAPFRLVLEHARIDDYMAISGPPTMTTTFDWTSRVVRVTDSESFVLGDYDGAAELALDDPEATRAIVHEHELTLEPGSAELTQRERVLWPAELPPESTVESVQWTHEEDIDPNLDTIQIDGAPHVHRSGTLMTFSAYSTFRRGATSDCI